MLTTRTRSSQQGVVTAVEVKAATKLQKKMQPPSNTITKQHYRMKNPICKKLIIPMVVPEGE